MVKDISLIINREGEEIVGRGFNEGRVYEWIGGLDSRTTGASEQ